VVCYLVVLLTAVSIHGEKCVLHKHLTDVEQWETQVSFVGRMKASFVRFHGEFMNETTYGPLGEDEVTARLKISCSVVQLTNNKR